jgi:CRP/FNR family transcriptional regulator, cyclic AMP receptor protein
MTTASELLAAHPFLAGIEERHLERLSYWSRKAVFHAGTRLFNEGSKADRFWLIREGEVRLDTHMPDESEVFVETIGAGRVLGWSWLFPPYRWRFGATAMSSVLAMEFDAAGVRGLCDSDPALGYDLTSRFMSIVINRLQSTRMRLLDAHRSPQ